MMTHNGVEKMNKKRPQRMDKERKKVAKTGRPASSPA